MNDSMDVSIDALSARALVPAGRATRRRWRERVASGAASFWREMYRELRRHAGNERLPFDLRGHLRTAAQRSLERSSDAERKTDAVRFPRLLLRKAVALRLPDAAEQEARRAAAAAGIDVDRPFVALQVHSRLDVLAETFAYLRREGYEVVRIGDPAAGSLRNAGVVDLASTRHVPSLDVLVLLTCRFLVCESAELQRACCVTNTPCVRLNASDVFSAYPVRGDSLYTLQRVVDLESGQLLETADLLTEGFFRNLRNYGYRNNTSAEIAAAVAEMHEALRDGWRDTEAQAQFRTRVAAAGEALAPRIPYVAKWGPEDGFIGDGRLARIQAERA